MVFAQVIKDTTHEVAVCEEKLCGEPVSETRSGSEQAIVSNFAFCGHLYADISLAFQEFNVLQLVDVVELHIHDSLNVILSFLLHLNF